ncbi:hypothetical protein DMENIID0001_043740 [Sergentomyia squamirostris]
MRLPHSLLNNVQEIVIHIGLDGSPISKHHCIWPILGRLIQAEQLSPFLIGIYEGPKDPQDSHVYLQDLTAEIKFLNEVGVLMPDGVTRKPFAVTGVIMDSKARATIAGVIGYTGHDGCGKCDQKGRTINNRIVFSTSSGTLRTDESFTNRVYASHHKHPYPYGLEVANVKMVSQLPLCPMHLLYLGVIRTLGVLWMQPKQNALFTLTTNQREALNTEHLKYGLFTPKEFSRKPDSMYFVSGWKATQGRQFLLYLGPIVLQNTLPETHYQHFMLLFIASRILSLKTLVADENYVNLAEILLQKFVEDYPTLYGIDQVTSNVHIIYCI